MKVVEELRNEADGLYGEERRPNSAICALMREAANIIERQAEEIDELEDESIVIVDESGEEIAVIEPELARHVRDKAIELYIEEALRQVTGMYEQTENGEDNVE